MLIDATTLRRTKPDESPIMELPSKTVLTMVVELDEVERLRAPESQAQCGADQLFTRSLLNTPGNLCEKIRD